ncbi:uncharacterized protein LOC110333274 isoform X1 [Mus pahari]|uniref:uncharacterized protein LOC110333274 isoform X1 n=1 Tax=Mus pahari TaxID=10093 RepID=UPI001114EA03|nr:uncharacterized protein LOC110333274 isoform X1 [Mus pahari]
MPGRMNRKAGSGDSGGAPRAQRRPTAAVPGRNRKGPSCPRPARAPAGTTAAVARLRGTRRTCPFRCGSLCLARRRFWIAGFIPIRLGSSPLTFPSCSRWTLASLPQTQPPSPKARACRETFESSLEVALVIPLSCSPSFVV